ncbi:MAG: GAF and ANTAR domain-containing protein [Mycobacteriales bacterium]|nr:GAF and ANTAR domain-containing protein [Frankia sp.]
MARQSFDLEHPSATELLLLLDAEDSFASTVGRISEIACRTLSRCDAASITVLNNDAGDTVASTSQVAVDLDESQYEDKSGPCLEAIRERTVYEVPNIAAEGRWPSLRAAADKAGIAAVLSLPMVVRGEASTGLNVYSKRAGAFDPEERKTGEMLAAAAAVAASNAHIYDASRRLSQQLEQAMASRAVIEQAKGILMAEQRCTPDDAFDLLRRASQRENVKLREIAQRIVAGRQPNAATAPSQTRR